MHFWWILGWMGQRSWASCFGSDSFLRSLPHLSFCFLDCFREWLRLNWKRTWIGLSKASSDQVMRCGVRGMGWVFSRKWELQGCRSPDASRGRTRGWEDGGVRVWQLATGLLFFDFCGQGDWGPHSHWSLHYNGERSGPDWNTPGRLWNICIYRWDRWMASPTRWTWVWASSRSWSDRVGQTGKPSVLQSTGSQRVGHDWVTEVNWS